MRELVSRLGPSTRTRVCSTCSWESWTPPRPSRTPRLSRASSNQRQCIQANWDPNKELLRTYWYRNCSDKNWSLPLMSSPSPPWVHSREQQVALCLVTVWNFRTCKRSLRLTWCSSTHRCLIWHRKNKIHPRWSNQFCWKLSNKSWGTKSLPWNKASKMTLI